jgi:F0F1-type ATP synthase assembly protein I
MSNLIAFAFIALLVITLLLAVRYAVHAYFPGWGTKAAGLVGAVAAVLPDVLDWLLAFVSQAQVLPWESIFGPAEAKAIAFGFAVSMVILRSIKRKAGA